MAVDVGLIGQSRVSDIMLDRCYCVVGHNAFRREKLRRPVCVATGLLSKVVDRVGDAVCLKSAEGKTTQSSGNRRCRYSSRKIGVCPGGLGTLESHPVMSEDVGYPDILQPFSRAIPGMVPTSLNGLKHEQNMPPFCQSIFYADREYQQDILPRFRGQAVRGLIADSQAA